MFRQFIIIAMSVATSIILMWSGIWLTWGYYTMYVPLDDVFAFVGPMLIVAGFGVPLAVTWEV